MKIKETGNIARLYRFSRAIWESFGGPRDYRHSSDLCTVMRTILIWMPLAVAINLAVIGFAALAVFQILQIIWLYIGVLGIVLLGLLGLALFVAMLIGIGVFGEAAIKAVDRSETLRVVKEYVRAKKSSICPIVEIVP